MVVLVRRNHLALFAVIFVISVFTFMLNQKEEAILTGAVPISNKVIVIDPGHGGEDGGAIGSLGIPEKDINLKIAKKLKALLEQGGDLVIMTREDDVSVHTKGDTVRGRKTSDLKNRKKIIDESGADIFVSIHLNMFSQSRYYGAQTFYPKNSEKSRKLAELIQAELKAIAERPNNREALEKSDIVILENPAIPGVLVECGFLSNPEEERLLNTEAYQDKLAFAIYSGITKYFNLLDEGSASL